MNLRSDDLDSVMFFGKSCDVEDIINLLIRSVKDCKSNYSSILCAHPTE